MAEWLKALAWNAGIRETVSRVRIPHSPPFFAKFRDLSLLTGFLFLLAQHPQICLYQPEIPQNVGNIARLAAATQARLHLVGPLGFSTSDKEVRRPGLDYWPYLDMEYHRNLKGLLAGYPKGSVAFFSKSAAPSHWELPENVKLLVFGRETSGLPQELHETYREHFYSIPMYHPGVRSLNLSNAVAIVLYHLLGKGQCHLDAPGGGAGPLPKVDGDGLG